MDEPKPLPNRDDLIARFQFTPTDLEDKRIKKFLLYKLSLDTEIYKLHRAHGNGRISDKISAHFGFTAADLKRPRISQAMKALSDSIEYLAKLKLVQP
jgi:hypothetical protein